MSDVQISKDQVKDFIKNMSVLDLSTLVKELEDELGVSAAAPVAVAAVGAAPAEAAVEEAKDAFTVVLTQAGEKRVQTIKVVRTVTGLGLKESKEIVEGIPSNIKEDIAEAEAKEIQKQFEEVGAKIEIK